MSVSLNLDHDLAKEPINRLVLQIIKDAIKLGADGILLELDLELHLKVEKESEVVREKYRRPTFYEAIFKKRFKDYLRFEKLSFRKLNVSRMFFELGQLPNALKLTYIINGVEKTMLPIRGCLFEDISQILSVAAGVTPKTSGEVSGVIETIKPVSKWMLESKDLTRQVQLRRIRAT
ncbi:MAG: hypothetical protein PHY43_09960 [Verrucomicrobiales bacterium]|nr:hypothetical protein [Verrucomicrobiales bacterium]